MFDCITDGIKCCVAQNVDDRIDECNSTIVLTSVTRLSFCSKY